MKSTIEQLDDLCKNLPFKLRLRCRMDVVARCLDKGIISIDADDGHWLWHGSKTLLAYFCGKMWCGDSCQKKKQKFKWIQTGETFPEAALYELFKLKLRTLRKNNKHRLLGEECLLIEEIFKKN